MTFLYDRARFDTDDFYATHYDTGTYYDGPSAPPNPSADPDLIWGGVGAEPFREKSYMEWPVTDGREHPVAVTHKEGGAAR